VARKVCVLTSAHPAFDVRIFHKECKSLAQAGYDVTLIASLDSDCKRDGITFIALPRWRGRADRLLRGSYSVYKKAIEANADIYHFHDPELIPTALQLRLAGKKVVYDIHEDLPRTISYKSYVPRPLKATVARVAEILENWAGRRFSALVAATPTIGNRFRNVNEKVVVVNNYPKIEEIGPRDADAHRENRAASLLYIGMRITRARGAEEMVRAIGLLPARLQASLTLVGEWDPFDLPRPLSTIPGWERTKFVGPLGRDGVTSELRKARAGLVILHPEPNYITSQPVKLFEYMCAGLPVIASDFPICREIVTNAKCGVLVDPRNAEEIASAMEFLLTNPAEADAMGQRGLQAVRDNYNWAVEEEVLLDVYRRLFVYDAAYQESLAGVTTIP
jgi:glycosyltransferase involved in cell wall biosynthesis